MDPLEALSVLDLRVGRVIRAEPNVGAHKPAFKLWIDFGPLGVKPSRWPGVLAPLAPGLPGAGKPGVNAVLSG